VVAEDYMRSGREETLTVAHSVAMAGIAAGLGPLALTDAYRRALIAMLTKEGEQGVPTPQVVIARGGEFLAQTLMAFEVSRSSDSPTRSLAEASATDPRSLERLWEEFRVLRHDYRGIEALTKPVVSRVPELADEVEEFKAHMTQILEGFVGLNLGQMSPRERAVLPEMARAYIDRGEREKEEAAQAKSRLHSYTAWVTGVQLLVAALAVLVSYLVARH
jgi:hypothetical protein